MARNEWNSYKMGDGLNIWGTPVFAGGLTHGDEVFDTLVMNGRVATGSLAGEELDINATYTYAELIEIRASISDWTGFAGNEFTGLYLRVVASVESAGMTMRGEEVFLSNADGLNITNMLGTFVGIMGKGNSTIALMRGAELVFTWMATDVLTDAVGLRIRFAGMSLPTNTIYGVEFVTEGDTAAINAQFQEIQMKTGSITISSYTADPNGVITAPAGSLCLVPTGSGAADRLWMNTDSGTTWTSIVTTA